MQRSLKKQKFFQTFFYRKSFLSDFLLSFSVFYSLLVISRSIVSNNSVGQNKRNVLHESTAWQSDMAIGKSNCQTTIPGQTTKLPSIVNNFTRYIKISSYRILRRVVLHVHTSHPIRNVFLQGNSHSPNLSTFTVLTILVPICISYSLLGILRWWFRDFNLDEAAREFEVACVEIVSFQSAENTTRVGRFSSSSFPQIPAVFDSAQCFHPPQPSAWLSILRFVYSTRLCVFKDIARESSHVPVRIIVELNYLTIKWKWMIKILRVT